MPNRKRKIDPDEESGAKLRLFVDNETMGDLAAVEPDPDPESIDEFDILEPRRPWSEGDVDWDDERDVRDRGSD